MVFFYNINHVIVTYYGYSSNHRESAPPLSYSYTLLPIVDVNSTGSVSTTSVVLAKFVSVAATDEAQIS